MKGRRKRCIHGMAVGQCIKSSNCLLYTDEERFAGTYYICDECSIPTSAITVQI